MADNQYQVFCGLKRTDQFHRCVKDFFAFLDKQAKKTSLDETQGYVKFYNYKIAFNTVVKKKGNEGLDKLCNEWKSLFDRMETSGFITEELIDFGDHWTKDDLFYVIFGDGKLPTKTKAINLFFFMRKFLERKNAVEKILQETSGDDEMIIGDIESINRVFEMKLRLFKIFRCIATEEGDVTLLVNLISDLETRLEIEPVNNNPTVLDPLGGVMDMVTGFFTGGGNERGDRPALPDLSQLGDLFKGNELLKDTLSEQLSKMRDCESGEELMKTAVGLLTDKDLHQKLTEALPGSAAALLNNGMNGGGDGDDGENNIAPNPMQFLQSMISGMVTGNQRTEELPSEHEY